MPRPHGATWWMFEAYGRATSSSLGGAVATKVALDHPPRALILESTFTSLPDVGGDQLPWLPARLLARFDYPTLDRVPRIDAPILVIHSRDDATIPYEHGERIFEAARQPKRFVEIAGDHNRGYIDSEEAYAKGIDEFLKR